MPSDDPIAALALSDDVPESISLPGIHVLALPVDPSVFRPDSEAGIDYALRFNGQSTSVAVDDIASVGDLRTFTIAMWVRPEGKQSSVLFAANMRDFGTQGGHAFVLTLEHDHGPSGPTLYARSWQHDIHRVGGIPTGVWSHIAFSYDADRGVGRLDIDGRPRGETRINEFSVELTDVRIGTGTGLTAMGTFRGELDDVAVWDEALSADQTASALSPTPTVETPAPLTRFRFDDGPGAERVVSRGRIPDIRATVVAPEWVFSSRQTSDTVRLDESSVVSILTAAVDDRAYDPRVFANPGFLAADAMHESAARLLETLDRATVVDTVSAGGQLWFHRTASGALGLQLRPPPGRFRPELSLVESYRLATFRGRYGPGRIVNTFSLLPGEETEITVSTFTSLSSTSERTDSILDSASSEVRQDFADDYRKENSRATSSSEEASVDAHAEVEADGGVWKGRGSVDAHAGAQAAREALATDISNVTTSRASQESAERNVQVSTTDTITRTEENRTQSVRTLRNINVGRTLNFVFRQMNQEYLSVLHLVDVQVRFRFVGSNQEPRTVPLSQLDGLLADVVGEEADRAEVRALVLREISGVRDHLGDTHPGFLVMSPAEDGREPYPRIDRRYVADDAPFSVPGVVIGVTPNIMRTHHVYVDTFIGEGEALDTYSRGLQDEALRRERLGNRLLAERVREVADLRGNRRRAARRALEGDDCALRVLQALVGDAGDDDPEP